MKATSESFLFALVVFTSAFMSKQFILSEGRGSEAERESAAFTLLRASEASLQEPITLPNFPPKRLSRALSEIDPRPAPLSLTAQAQSAAKEPLRPDPPPPAERERTQPHVSASAYLVHDLTSGVSLLEVNRHGRWPTASLAKLMTAVVAFEKIGPEKPIPITARAAAIEGQRAGLRAGEAFRAMDLISIMLTVSANDAAEALADFYGREAFIEAMAEKARALDMTQTTFADPTGLSIINQSTIHDWEMFVEHLLAAYPELFAASRSASIEGIEIISGERRLFKNINFFAGTPNFIGGKTGFTEEARGNLISVFDAHARRLLIVVLGSEDRVKDTKMLYEFTSSD